MKYKLIRMKRETGEKFVIGKFLAECDALWSASVFSANPAFDACLHYVEHKNFITHAPAKLPGNIRIYKPED
jgi:hypothetical protein